MGRPVVLFAVIIALCCLPGCGAIVGVLGNADDEEDSPVLQNPYEEDDKPMLQHRDDDKNTLDASKDLSVSGMLSKPACRTANSGRVPKVGGN
jgi:hypothetical protein